MRRAGRWLLFAASRSTMAEAVAAFAVTSSPSRVKMRAFAVTREASRSTIFPLAVTSNASAVALAARASQPVTAVRVTAFAKLKSSSAGKNPVGHSRRAMSTRAAWRVEFPLAGGVVPPPDGEHDLVPLRICAHGKMPGFLAWQNYTSRNWYPKTHPQASRRAG